MVIGEVRDDASTKEAFPGRRLRGALRPVASSIAHEHGASVDTLCIVAL